jgi:hypothetical protein
VNAFKKAAKDQAAKPDPTAVDQAWKYAANEICDLLKKVRLGGADGRWASLNWPQCGGNSIYIGSGFHCQIGSIQALTIALRGLLCWPRGLPCDRGKRCRCLPVSGTENGGNQNNGQALIN